MSNSNQPAYRKSLFAPEEPVALKPVLEAMDPHLYNPVKMSFGRCVAKPGFLDRFYQIFLGSNPIIGHMFSKTDLAVQKNLLKQGLNMVMMYSEGSVLAKKAVERIRDSHSAKKLNVPPNLYIFWENSLMKTIAEFDPEYTPGLEAHWRSVLKPALDVIKNGYQTIK
ncbi:MAG: globin [Deltaproteobacteria bacterium]|nr:globin [Deltaproteobacteria bacterium]